MQEEALMHFVTQVKGQPMLPVPLPALIHHHQDPSLTRIESPRRTRLCAKQDEAPGDFTVLLASFLCNRVEAAKDAINRWEMGCASDAALTASAIKEDEAGQ